jgi:hypothetical protein
MDTYTPDPAPYDWQPPSSEPPAAEGLDKRAYAEPALRLCGAVPTLTGGSDIFGDMTP